MVEINASREISAPLDRVWDLLSGVYSTPRFWWDLHVVYAINENDNAIESEGMVGFRDSKGARS
jgi:uncharacterized protein YndB with AHSA1/START domain